MQEDMDERAWQRFLWSGEHDGRAAIEKRRKAAVEQGQWLQFSAEDSSRLGITGADALE